MRKWLTCYKTIFIFFFLLDSLSNFTSADEFKIEDYITGTVKDSQLYFNGGTSLSSLNSSTEPIVESFDEFSESDVDQFVASLSGKYIYEYLSVSKFLQTSITLSGSCNYNKNNYNNKTEHNPVIYDYAKSKSETSSYNPYYNISIDGGYYLTDDFYVSTTLYSYGSFTDYPTNKSWRESATQYQYGDMTEIQYRQNSNDEDRDNKSFDLSIGLMPGWGRVYEGRYASLAMYLIEELQNKGIIVRQPNHKQMTQLSELIYQGKNEYYIDSRLHDIDIIERLTDYLLSENLIENKAAYTGMTINDVYRYFPQTRRRFGYRFRAGAILAYSYRKTNRDRLSWDYRNTTRYASSTPEIIDTISESEQTYRLLSANKSIEVIPSLEIAVEYYKPINHRWQFDIGANFDYHLNQYSKITETEEQLIDLESYDKTIMKYEIDKLYSLETNCKISYILNSRTSATFSAHLDYDKFDRTGKLTEIDDSSRSDITLEPGSFDDWAYGIRASVDYRISIPVTLTASCGYSRYTSLSSIYTSQTYSKNDNFEFNINLKYYLF